jgi:hypothetical protein
MTQQSPENTKTMRLALPSGWVMVHNYFFDVAPIKDSDPESDWIDNVEGVWGEDMLWIHELRWEKGENAEYRHVVANKNCYSIDMGWYDTLKFSGQYCVTLDWCGEEFITADHFCSRDRFAIRDKIEEWIWEIFRNPEEAYNRWPRASE